MLLILPIFDAYLWLSTTHDSMQISMGRLSPVMCARVEIVFIELKK